MKKFVAAMLCIIMALGMTAVMAEDGTGVYTMYNKTGEKLAELYIYAVGSEDKGVNYAPDFKNGMELTYTGAADSVLTVEFVTESGYTGTFDRLHIETAPITMLSADAMTGATMISFFAPQETGTYTMYNKTGEALAELYIYPVASEDKGTNYAVDFQDGMEINYTGVTGTVLTVEFVTESGYVGTFNTLHIEVAPITMLSADAMTGATMISFFAPKD